MKKFISFVLSLTLLLGLYIPAYATTTNTADKLAPYQAVIDKVNSDLGSSTYIPTGTEDEVYDKIKGKSLDEFETELRKEYKAFLYQSSKDATGIIQKGTDILPFSIRENITQTYPILYDSNVVLNSKVFSGTGASGSYTYESIINFGTSWPGNTGYHFKMDPGQSFYSLSSNRKNCTVSLTGIPVDPNGLALAIVIRANHTFNAG